MRCGSGHPGDIHAVLSVIPILGRHIIHHFYCGQLFFEHEKCKILKTPGDFE